MSQVEYMKEFGSMIKDTIMDLNYLQVAILTKESTLMGRLMVKVFIHIRMEKFMMVIGLKGKKLGLEFGKDFMMILIWENGLIIKFMVLVFINGLTGIGMKVNGKIH